jgi:OFA family oxalate/formate antiporter-like MFS transporter
MTTLAATPALATTRYGTRWFVLAGALLIQLILGTIYGYSVFWQPLESTWYPPVLTEAEAAVLADRGEALPATATVVADAAEARTVHAARQGYLKYAFGICLLSFATAMVFAGRLQDIRGPRFTAILGGILLALGFLVAGQAEHLITFYFAHAVLMGAIVIVALLAYHALRQHLDPEKYPIANYIPHGIVTVAVVAGVVIGNKVIDGSLRDRLFLLWATIGLLAGVGIGFAYVCPIAALVKWFPRHKGLVSGLAVAGFGCGALFFSQQHALGAVGFIDKAGITTFFTVHAIVSLVVVCGGAMLLCNPPSGWGQTAPPGKQTQAATKPSGIEELTWQETLRSPRFYLVWSMFFSGALAGLLVIGILKPFAGAQLVDAAAAGGASLADADTQALLAKGAAAVGWLAIFNAAGRVVWGLLSDRLGRTVAMAAMFTLQAVTMLMLILLKSEWTLAVGAACVGFNFGGNFALFPSLTADLFGSKNFGANYGWVFTSYGIAGVIGVALGNAAMRWTGSYFAAFAIAAVLCILSANLALTLRRLTPARA